MKIVGFSGSPRKDGNTDILVNQIMVGASEKGAEVKFFHLNKMNIKPCQADNYCKSHDRCAMKDDMQGIYDEIMSADAVVLGSPVYMWQMSAQTKILVDRFYAFLNEDYTSKVKGKNIVLAYAQGNPQEDIFKGYFDYNANMLHFLGFNVKDTLVAAGVRDKGDVLKNPELMEKAKDIGKSLIP